MHVLCISISKSFTAIRSPGRQGHDFPPVGPSQWVLFSLFPPLMDSQAREFQIAAMIFLPLGSGILPMDALFTFPPAGAFQWVLFSLFPPVGASQARESQIVTTTTPRKTAKQHLAPLSHFLHKIPYIPCFLNVFARFCNGFLQSTVI